MDLRTHNDISERRRETDTNKRKRQSPKTLISTLRSSGREQSHRRSFVSQTSTPRPTFASSKDRIVSGSAKPFAGAAYLCDRQQTFGGRKWQFFFCQLSHLCSAPHSDQAGDLLVAAARQVFYAYKHVSEKQSQIWFCGKERTPARQRLVGGPGPCRALLQD